jgi:PAS domain-containing protein
VEYRILNKDGKIKYLRTGGRVVKSKTDEFVTGTVCDITDYMLLTKKLSGNQQLLRVIIDSSTDAISAFDNNLQCLVWNESSARIYGKPSSEAIGNYLFDILPQFNREDISGLIKNITDNNPAIEKDNHKIEIENLSIEIIPAANLCEDKTGLVLITKNKQ